MHSLVSYKDVAGRLADEALGSCARVLEEREREGVRRAVGGGDDEGGGEGEEGGAQAIGMREVLRGLSRVLDER